MAKKLKKPELKHTPTTRQLSKWERQKKLQRIVVLTGLIFIIIILGFIGFGYYDSAIRPFQKTVMEVGATTYNMDYYIKMLGIYLQGNDSVQALQTQYLVSQKMINNAVVLQRADTLGVTVQDKDIDAEIAKLKIPDDGVYRNLIKADLLTQKLIQDNFDSKIDKSADQADARAIFVDSEETAKDAIAMIQTSDNFTAVVNKFNVEPYISQKGGQLDTLPKGYVNQLMGYPQNSKLDEVIFSTNKGEISKPVYDPVITKNSGYWLLKVIEKDGDVSRRTSGILVGTYSEAMDVKKRLENGEDFAALAKQLSQDSSKENGGDIGWLHKDYGKEYINNAAFALETGKISAPIRDNQIETTGGYWIVKVVRKELNKEIASAIRDTIVNTNLQNWIDEQKKTMDFKDYLSENEKSQIVNTIMKVKK